MANGPTPASMFPQFGAVSTNARSILTCAKKEIDVYVWMGRGADDGDLARQRVRAAKAIRSVSRSGDPITARSTRLAGAGQEANDQQESRDLWRCPHASTHTEYQSEAYLFRHSPDELWNDVDDSRRRGSREAIGGLRSASGVPTVPNDVRSGDLAIFPGIQAHSSRRDDASAPPVATLGLALVAVHRSAAKFPGTIPWAPYGPSENVRDPHRCRQSRTGCLK